MGFGKIRPAQLLPAVHPELPEIGICKEPGPPGGIEEAAGAPAARIGVAMVNRTQGAVKIPVRAVSDLSAAGFVQVSAEGKSVHISTEHFQDVEIDPGIDIDIGPIALDGMFPIR